MNRLLLKVFFILLAIIIFEVGYYLFIPTKKLPPTAGLPTTASPTPSTTNEVIYTDRNTVYTSSKLLTPYLGMGLITATIKETLLVFPLPTGRPFYVSPSEENQYSDPGKFQKFHIKTNENAMAYTVGYFKSWETIDGSNDKVIILSDPNNEEITFSYRVAFQESDLFGENLTSLAVEDTDKVKAGVEKTTEEFKTPIAGLPTSTLENLIQIGDTVVITPIFDPPEPNKKDAEGRILAGWLILRRAGGKNAINQELGNIIE